MVRQDRSREDGGRRGDYRPCQTGRKALLVFLAAVSIELAKTQGQGELGFGVLGMMNLGNEIPILTAILTEVRNLHAIKRGFGVVFNSGRALLN